MSVTNRVYKTEKLIEFAVNSTTDASIILTDAAGNSYFSLGDIDWTRIVIETDFTITGGSSPVVRVTGLTTNQPGNPLATTTDIQALQGDASTVFRTASISATGRTMITCARQASTGASASNIGRSIGFMLEKVSGTLASTVGTVRVYIKGQ
jgi:hypothetical protein